MTTPPKENIGQHEKRIKSPVLLPMDSKSHYQLRVNSMKDMENITLACESLEANGEESQLPTATPAIITVNKKKSFFKYPSFGRSESFSIDPSKVSLINLAPLVRTISSSLRFKRPEKEVLFATQIITKEKVAELSDDAAGKTILKFILNVKLRSDIRRGLVSSRAPTITVITALIF